MLRIDLATTLNRARTDALQRRPYCLSSEGVEREYKRTGREEQGLSLQQPATAALQDGGRLIRHARYFTLQVAESQLTQTLSQQIIGRLERLAWDPP